MWLLEFSHPPFNVVRLSDMEELVSALTAAEADGARVVILTGGVPGWFAGHADLGDLVNLDDPQARSGDPAAWANALRLLDHGPFVSIAAINGDALGGGVELALACNLRWLSEAATLSFPEVRLGIVPGSGMHRLAELVPENLALELLAGGEIIDATRALDVGLVNRVCPAHDLLGDVLRFARLLSTHPPEAVLAIRTLLHRQRPPSYRQLQREQLDVCLSLLGSAQASTRIATAQASYRRGAGPHEALGY